MIHLGVRTRVVQFWFAMEYRGDGFMTTYPIARWEKALSADREQPWYLITTWTVRSGPRSCVESRSTP